MATYDQRLNERLHRLGEAVRSARTGAELSQEQLAELAGVHRTYVGAVERGERNISVGSMYALADALGISPTNFFTP